MLEEKDTLLIITAICGICYIGMILLSFWIPQ